MLRHGSGLQQSNALQSMCVRVCFKCLNDVLVRMCHHFYRQGGSLALCQTCWNEPLFVVTSHARVYQSQAPAVHAYSTTTFHLNDMNIGSTTTSSSTTRTRNEAATTAATATTPRTKAATRIIKYSLNKLTIQRRRKQPTHTHKTKQ